MNVVFVKFDEQSVRGPLAELWGLVPTVSAETEALLHEPTRRGSFHAVGGSLRPASKGLLANAGLPKTVKRGLMLNNKEKSQA